MVGIMKDYEIIVPCARFNDLKGVLDLGIDAVYVGIAGWSRSNRGNEFSISQLKEAVEICHYMNSKLYVSFNLIPSPFESKMVFKVLESAVACGVDAFIVSDLSIMERLVSWGIEVHASLGTTSINLEDVLFYEEIGVKRVVLSPNLTLKEIEEINRNVVDSSVELEVMVHGIKCNATYLGICRLSSFLEILITNSGVRTLVWEGSPKRSGVCYRPCAQEWILEGKSVQHMVSFSPCISCDLYPVEDLIKAGIKFFKIGGRGMPLSYFKNVIEKMKDLLGGKCRNV